MFWLCLVTFGLLLVGMFLVLNLSPEAIEEDMPGLLNPEQTIKQKAIRLQKKKKPNPLRNLLNTTNTIMKYMGQSSKFTIVCVASVLLAVLGVVLSVYIKNLFLIPAFAIGFFSLPFIFVHLYSHAYNRNLHNELETTLSQITISYMRMNDIVKAVEENLDSINPPIRKPFEEFISQVRYVNPNKRQALDDLQDKIDDDIFAEWCDGMKKCVANRTLKYMLMPTVNKYSTLRNIENKVKNTLMAIRMQFIMIVGIVYLNFPLLKGLNEDWYSVLFDTTIGNATVGLVALITVICTIILVYITKPLKYRV